MPYSIKVLFLGSLMTLSLAVVGCEANATVTPDNPVTIAVISTQPAIAPEQTPTPIPVPLPIPTDDSIGAPVDPPDPTAIPTATHPPVPTATQSPRPTPTVIPTAIPTPTPNYVPPTGYDIFGPGGQKGDCTSNPEPVFTSNITDLSMISTLTRAGTVQGGDLKPHGYLGNNSSFQNVPVYAPVDSYLITYAHYADSGNALYQFMFQVSCEVGYYFDHLREVVSQIQEIVPDVVASDSRGSAVNPPLFFQAGDLIGHTGGSPGSQIWDFGVLNNQVWNDLPPAETYTYSPNADKYRFAVCQYQYFPADIKQQYLTKLGAQGCGP